MLRNKRYRWILLLCGGIVLSVLLISTKELIFSPPMRAGSYVGSKACVDCHEPEVEKWKRSLHSRTMQPPLPENVKGDFTPNAVVKNTVDFISGPYSRETEQELPIRMSQQDGKFFMTFTGADGSEQTFRVDYTVGHRNQAYLTRLESEGFYAVLPPFWNDRERKWVVYFWRNYTVTCAQCHATGQEGRTQWARDAVVRYPYSDPPLYVPKGARWTEDGVRCEMCHGPGSVHVDVMKRANILRRRLGRYVKWLIPRSLREAVLRTVNPINLSTERQVQVCGVCHADGYASPIAYVPGDEIANEPQIKPEPGKDTGYFWADGRGKDPHVIYQAFLSTGHYPDLTCTDCHDAHGSEYPADLTHDDSDRLCLSCHEEIRENLVAHTRHSPESSGSRCIACHMPKIEGFRMGYGIDLDTGVPTHSLTKTPSPENSIKYGTPNACTLCHRHREKSAEWAAYAMGYWRRCTHCHMRDHLPKPETPPPSDVQFLDVTAEAGIAFRHSQGTELALVPEVMGAGCGFEDYDGDGNLDIYLVNGSGPSDGSSTNLLYRNNGDGTFTDVTEKAGVGDRGWGMGCVFGDYDNDGDPDLYITNYGPNVLYRNDGDGTFTDVTEGAGVGDDRWGSAAAFGDYDNDGDLDLYVGNYLAFDPSLVPEADTTTVEGEPPPSLMPKFVSFPYESQGNALYRNNGDGTFTDVARRTGVANSTCKTLGVVFFDYDDDGWLDLYVANDGPEDALFRNERNGRFSDITVFAGVADPRAGMGLTFGDYDNDGDLDIFSTHWHDQLNVLYRNDAGIWGRTFEDVTVPAGLDTVSIGFVGWGTDLFDYDNDGDLDIFIANGFTNPSREDLSVCIGQEDVLLRNDGDGTFEDVTAMSGAALRYENAGRGAAFGDYDNDGDVDILVTNNNGPAVLLRNEGGNRTHWLKVRTVGTVSNRDGVGARIKVVSGSTTQVRQICAGSSYLSHNSLEAEFGLGPAHRADRIEVRWPSGIVEAFEDIPADQTVILREGEGQRLETGPRPGRL